MQATLNMIMVILVTELFKTVSRSHIGHAWRVVIGIIITGVLMLINVKLGL